MCRVVEAIKYYKMSNISDSDASEVSSVTSSNDSSEEDDQSSPEVGKKRPPSYGKFPLEIRQKLVHDVNVNHRDLIDAAKSQGIPITTARRIVKGYNANQGQFVMLPRGGYKKKKLDDEQIDTIKRWLDEDCTVSLESLKERIEEEFNVIVCVTNISK